MHVTPNIQPQARAAPTLVNSDGNSYLRLLSRPCYSLDSCRMLPISLAIKGQDEDQIGVGGQFVGEEKENSYGFPFFLANKGEGGFRLGNKRGNRSQKKRVESYLFFGI